VTRRPSPPPQKEPPPRKLKRLTVDIDPELHTQFKIACAKRGVTLADELRRLIEELVKKAD
jgi:predicted HicB family RNase H-like nuclease